MGHSIVRCSCGNDIMEGYNYWFCEKCGNYYGNSSNSATPRWAIEARERIKKKKSK